jgi:hypothetical protein
LFFLTYFSKLFFKKLFFQELCEGGKKKKFQPRPKKYYFSKRFARGEKKIFFQPRVTPGLKQAVQIGCGHFHILKNYFSVSCSQKRSQLFNGWADRRQIDFSVIGETGAVIADAKQLKFVKRKFQNANLLIFQSVWELTFSH